MAIIGNKSIKELTWIVVSDKMAHTIVVEVSVVRSHPLYKKRFTKKKKYYAHNADNIAQLGDVVRIREIRPLSRLKRWNLVEVVTKSVV